MGKQVRGHRVAVREHAVRAHVAMSLAVRPDQHGCSPLTIPWDIHCLLNSGDDARAQSQSLAAPTTGPLRGARQKLISAGMNFQLGSAVKYFSAKAARTPLSVRHCR